MWESASRCAEIRRCCLLYMEMDVSSCEHTKLLRDNITKSNIHWCPTDMLKLQSQISGKKKLFFCSIALVRLMSLSKMSKPQYQKCMKLLSNQWRRNYTSTIEGKRLKKLQPLIPLFIEKARVFELFDSLSTLKLKTFFQTRSDFLFMKKHFKQHPQIMGGITY